jgi:hypothetical protein
MLVHCPTLKFKANQLTDSACPAAAPAACRSFRHWRELHVVSTGQVFAAASLDGILLYPTVVLAAGKALHKLPVYAHF